MEGYHWRLENWHTEWSALDGLVESGPHRLTYTFETTWACPEPVLQKLAEMFPPLCFHVKVSGEIDVPECYSFTINLKDPKDPWENGSGGQ